MRGRAGVTRRKAGPTGAVAALLAVGTCGLVVSVGGPGARAFADTPRYELYCPGTPVGNIVLNDVDTTGTITPPAPAAGQSFSVTGYRTTLDLPSSIVSAAAALGNADIAGTGSTRVDVSGASPSRMASNSTFDIPIPSPVPDDGLEIALPSRAATIGPFTSSGGDLTVTEDGSTHLALTVSGSTLDLGCVTYPNHSAPTGITNTSPHTTPISPVIATYTIPLAVTTSRLPGATVGQSYSAPLVAQGGHPPYIWKLVPGSGVLPRGLKLHLHTGVISGVPRSRDAGTPAFTVEVQDRNRTTVPHTSETATKVLSITFS